jgi:hypothetical protein
MEYVIHPSLMYYHHQFELLLHLQNQDIHLYPLHLTAFCLLFMSVIIYNIQTRRDVISVNGLGIWCQESPVLS